MDEMALHECRARIEQELGWGEASGWTTREFEDLSLQIQEKTGNAVSATTLKRVWGRVAYHSQPSRHTLDTLATFLDHPSWRAFAAAFADDSVSRDDSSGRVDSDEDKPPSTTKSRDPAVDTAASTARAPDPTREVSASIRPALACRSLFGRLPRRMLYAGGSAFILVAAIALWAGLKASPEQAVASRDVRFDSRPVSNGLPNTVVFEYDVRGVAADSFFIQQSWDESRRARISPERHTFTSTYYEPGYYNAKLVANTTVLQEHPVHVTTDGWLALVENDPVPIYLEDVAVPGAGYLGVGEDGLRDRGIDTGSESQIVSFYNVRSFDSLHTDQFMLDTIVRHEADEGRYPCKRLELIAVGEQSALVLLLGIPGCAGDLGAMFGDVYLDGSTNDLSALAVDLGTWQRVQLSVMDRVVRVKVGSNAEFTSGYTMDIGRLVGLQYRFEGGGAIDHVTLTDGDGGVVYEETF